MKISELAVLLEGTFEGDANTEIISLSGIANSKVGDLTFAMDEERFASAEQSQSSCILTTKNTRTSSKPLIRVHNPKLAFLIAYNILLQKPGREASIHPTAAIASSVQLGENVCIASHVTIEEDVVIGNNVMLESGVTVKRNCKIGDFCHLQNQVVLYENTILENNVVLHSGVIVGSDGFGYVKDKGIIYKFPQLGKVIIRENVEIGANSTIDRGSLDDTIIGPNSKIDNLCHIAHNVKIGKNFIMAAQSGIAGSTVIGDNVTISGQVAITDNVTIGHNVKVGGKSAVIGHIEDNAVFWGIPARPLKQVKRQMAVLAWLTKNFSFLSRSIKEKEVLTP